MTSHFRTRRTLPSILSAGWYQALSASVLSAALHRHFEEKAFGKLRELLREADEKEASIREFRWVAVQAAAAKTLDDFDPVSGLPEHEDFNRHASAHGVGQPQYGQANALTVLMLVSALLIELDQIGPMEP